MKKDGVGVYHCISRSVALAFLLDEEAKAIFCKMLWRVADFSGVEVLAYCAMTNHFHILLRVRPAEVLTREEVLRRYAVLYTESNTPGYPDASVLRTIFEGTNDALAEEWMERLTARMNDLSAFMKTLKQRLTMWYNKRHNRFGTLWSERFKSVLVQDDPNVLRTVAAYIDLNPVRAGLAEDPSSYAWCSYGEAMRGGTAAQTGLVRALQCRERCREWAEASVSYRQTLLGKAGGGERRSLPTNPPPEGHGLRAEPETQNERTVGAAVVAADVEVVALLQTRQPAFTDGKILGSAAFVQAESRRNRPTPSAGEAEAGANCVEKREKATAEAEGLSESERIIGALFSARSGKRGMKKKQISVEGSE